MNRDLARLWTAYDGAVKVWYLPYRPFGFHEAFNNLMGDDLSSVAKQTFSYLDYSIVDCEISSNAPTVWKAFKRYMAERKQFDLKGNWDKFGIYGSVTLLDELGIGYEETRETLLSDTYYSRGEDSDDADPKA